jgi:hypothetical protein
MNKKPLFIIFCIAAIISPLAGQDKPAATPPADASNQDIIDDKVYFETILEDFETTQYTTEKNLSFRVTTYQKGDITMRDQYAAPSGKSKKYLGVKMYAKKGDVYSIIPAKELKIDKYCRSIAVWVYGKRFSGELSMIIQDADQQNHRVILGNTDFLGWRKMIVKLDKVVKQEDEYLNQKRFIQIMQIQYRPGNATRLPLQQYFYLDDISAMVRDKYTDRQSDEW